MAAVIRLKRRLEDEPRETLILSCKRRKTDENVDYEDAQLSTLLKLAGTFKNQEDDIFTNLKKPTKQELEQQFKKHPINLSDKLRVQKQINSKAGRYKVVNCFRSNGGSERAEGSGDANEFTVYDIETESQPESIACSSDSKYVYDLYYTISDDLGDACFEDYVGLYPYNGDLVFGPCRDNGAAAVDSDDDSEDSNAESNWKNDYPDESDLESVTEDDMVKAMTRCDLDDLSSDDGEEGFAYSVDSESAGFEEDIDDSDVQRYGERYARFKALNKKNVETTTLQNDLYYGDIDEEEYYY